MFVINDTQQGRPQKIIDINPINFFEIIDYEPEGNAKVRFTYKIMLDGMSKNPEDENYYKDFGFLDIKLVSLEEANDVKKTIADTAALNKPLDINSFLNPYNEKNDVEDRLLMFSKLVSKNAENELKTIAKETVDFSSEMSDVFNCYFRTTEIESLKNNLSETSLRKTAASFDLGINAERDFLDYVCNLKDDITNIVDINVNSNNNINSLNHLNLYQKNLLSTVFSLSNEQKNNVEQDYSVKHVDKQINYLIVQVDVTFKHVIYGSHFSVVAEIRKTQNDSDVYESFRQTVNLQENLFAFSKIQKPPIVSFKEESNSITFYISAHESDMQKIAGYNLYVKELNSTTKDYSFKKAGNMTSDTLSITVTKPEVLSVYRVVPIDLGGNESFIFTNVVVGSNLNDSYSKDNKPIISVYQVYNSSEIKIEVDNIPKKNVLLEIYRRHVEDNTFQMILSSKADGFFTSNIILNETSLSVGKIFDYYVKASYTENGKNYECFSDSVLYKHVNTVLNSPISVSVSNMQRTPVDYREYLEFKNSLTSNGYQNYLIDNYNFAFNISVAMEKTQLENITEYIKVQAPDFYAQYLDPANNEKLIDKPNIDYSSIFVHEVHRLDMVTGERCVYPIVGAGLFADTQEVRDLNQIPGIDPTHDYEYQVFTYKRSPLTLLKNFVATGYDKKGKIWFYSPYKWKNSQVVNSGMLYAEDDQGVYVEKIETFTSECYGLTFKQPVNFSYETSTKNYASLTRIDRNTVHLSWEIKKGLVNYDCFLLVKVINGIKTIVGRSKENFAYIDITDNDVGGLRFEIIPVSSNFKIFESIATNYLIIQPESINKPLKISNMMLGIN